MLQEQWPSTWQGALSLLKVNGYKEPTNLFVCLSDVHPPMYSTMYSADEECQYCHVKASKCIKYSYLSLADKVIRWCGDKDFCKKMTAHWIEKDRWLNVSCRRVSSKARNMGW